MLQSPPAVVFSPKTAFGVNEKIFVLFYRSIIESILCYGITVWFGNLFVQSKSAFLLNENCHENNRFHISHDLPSGDFLTDIKKTVSQDYL